LDATWSTYFADTLLQQIREGRHRLIIDAQHMSFLSSAGIRALVIIYKELNKVQGIFCLVSASAFVEQTLRMSGFEKWLQQEFPEDMPSCTGSAEDQQGSEGFQFYPLNKNAQLKVTKPANWQPWQKIDQDTLATVSFDAHIYALGIGSAADSNEEALNRLGEFLAVGGNVVFQPPQEQGPPDYLLAEGTFVPQLQCAQALCLQGEMAQLLRFAPTDTASFFPLSTLLRAILAKSTATAVGFVILAEIEGLVGATLIQSPGKLKTETALGFPEIRDWLSFCGERCHANQQVLLTGIVSTSSSELIPQLPGQPELSAHIHAAIFPYQPLANGEIELTTSVGKFVNGPPPVAVIHLVEDPRPVVGLGESALIRGACWYAPLQNSEVLL
jgi:anti-anti-sigma factor